MADIDERRRMRKAAHMALDQLDWCVAYLRSIRKMKVAAVLAENRDELLRRLREAEERDRPPDSR